MAARRAFLVTHLGQALPYSGMTPDLPPPPRPFPELLQERLITFAVAVCDEARQTPRGLVTASMIEQVVRSATSAAANYAEARAAQSRRDFIHKMQVSLKDLRETQVWIELLRRAGELPTAATLGRECGELTAIFVASINTASRRGRRGSPIRPA
jgi:four helix bundle protein